MEIHKWTAGPICPDRYGPYLPFFVREFPGNVFIKARKIIPEFGMIFRKALGWFSGYGGTCLNANLLPPTSEQSLLLQQMFDAWPRPTKCLAFFVAFRSWTFNADLFLSQDDKNPKIHKIIEKSRFYYINGLRDLFVQIDMVLTFHFRPGIPRKCLYKSPENHPRVWDDFPENSGMIFQAFTKTSPGNSRTKMEGKGHIYLD